MMAVSPCNTGGNTAFRANFMAFGVAIDGNVVFLQIRALPVAFLLMADFSGLISKVIAPQSSCRRSAE